MPDPPVFEKFIVNGTTMATLYWFHVSHNALRGPQSGRSYIVSSRGVNQTITDNSIVVSGPGGATLVVEVGIASEEIFHILLLVNTLLLSLLSTAI